jgi:arabinofuranosyltransferase
MTAMLRRFLQIDSVLIALLAIAARVLPTPRTIDDAFITFRYARNLLAGSGFVFNAGQHVLGTTTPLYTLVMAALAGGLHSSNYPWLALLVNALADGATCLLLVPLGHRLSGTRVVGVGAALLWAISPMSVTFAVGGMETSAFILLLVAAAYLYLAGRTRAAAVASALLLLARPDGVLLLAPLGLDLVVRQARLRRFPAAEAALFLAVVLPWVLFASLYFGSAIPHSITAKSLAYQHPPLEALVRLLQHYGTPFFEHNLLGTYWTPIGFIVYLTLSVSGGLMMIRRDTRAWPIAVFPWLYFAAYAAANPLIFRWYLPPPLPFYFLLILTGIQRVLMEASAAWGARRPAQAQRWMAVPVAAFAVLSLRAWTLRPDHGPSTPAPQMAWHLLELYYAGVGRELAPSVTATTVIAAGDVGALGYYSGARILDTVGLMSPEASAYFPLELEFYSSNYAIPPQLILDQRPDYIVLLEIYGRKGLLRDPRFTDTYELVNAVDSDIYGSRGLLVYQRRSP